MPSYIGSTPVDLQGAQIQTTSIEDNAVTTA